MVPVVLSVLVAAFVKGSIGFGFPTLGTPLLSLFVDVKTSILVLIVPNIVMDGVQFARRGAPLATVRRMATLVAFGAVGTVLGTRLLALLSSRTVMLILGGFILLFTAFGNQYWHHGLGGPISSLPVQIYTYAISPFDDWHRQAWAGALVLLTLIATTSLTVRILTRGRFRTVR